MEKTDQKIIIEITKTVAILANVVARCVDELQDDDGKTKSRAELQTAATNLKSVVTLMKEWIP